MSVIVIVYVVVFVFVFVFVIFIVIVIVIVTRSTREKAEVEVGPTGSAVELTRVWRENWEQLYPNINIEWKHIVSRFQYHFGAERRDSLDGADQKLDKSTPIPR